MALPSRRRRHRSLARSIDPSIELHYRVAVRSGQWARHETFTFMNERPDAPDVAWIAARGRPASMTFASNAAAQPSYLLAPRPTMTRGDARRSVRSGRFGHSR